MPEINAQVSKAFVNVISAKAKAEEDSAILSHMDFPTLDEMEMDSPLLDEHLYPIFGDDESEVDMQCLLRVSPTLSVSSLSL